MEFHMSDFISSSDSSSGSGDSSHHLFVSRWPIFVFLVSAALCLTCSTCFHLFYVVNKNYYRIFLRMDYAGVSLLISGSTFPIFYYAFYC